MNIRIAKPEDATALFSIKNNLPLPSGEACAARGGFLLGTDVETYRRYIQLAHCLVAETDGVVKGFGIVFPDAVIRSTDLWQKRAAVRWMEDIARLEEKALCYFEQLAFLPGYRNWSAPLCYQLLKNAFAAGSNYMLTTVVRKPFYNKAAVPLIKAVGGKKLGNIDEYYPGIGDINSDVFGVDRTDFFIHTASHRLFRFVQARLPKESAL